MYLHLLGNTSPVLVSIQQLLDIFSSTLGGTALKDDHLVKTDSITQSEMQTHGLDPSLSRFLRYMHEKF